MKRLSWSLFSKLLIVSVILGCFGIVAIFHWEEENDLKMEKEQSELIQKLEYHDSTLYSVAESSIVWFMGVCGQIEKPLSPDKENQLWRSLDLFKTSIGGTISWLELGLEKEIRQDSLYKIVCFSVYASDYYYQTFSILYLSVDSLLESEEIGDDSREKLLILKSFLYNGGGDLSVPEKLLLNYREFCYNLWRWVIRVESKIQNKGARNF